MTFVLHRVPTPPAPDAPPEPLVRAAAALGAEVLTELYGHDDFAEDAAATVVRLHGTPYHATSAWVALPAGLSPDACQAGDALGVAWLDRGLADDLQVAELHVQVRADARRRGVGAALYGAAAEAARADGRSTEMGWSFARGGVPPESRRRLAAASGSGSVDRAAPGNAWALSMGFALEQVERLSVLTLADVPAARLAALEAEASLASSQYEVVRWAAGAPGEWATDAAGLVGRMSTDAPSAGLHLGVQQWDADRLRTAERSSLARGERWVTAAAVERASGRLVALTALYWRAARPAGVWQQITLVSPEHRGHRLGLRLKAANLAFLREQNPDAVRVSTWNAVENGPMLAINDLLGFRTFGFEGAWQKRTDAGEAAGAGG